jgi:chromatin remodeling complex protein RSC6
MYINNMPKSSSSNKSKKNQEKLVSNIEQQSNTEVVSNTVDQTLSTPEVVSNNVTDGINEESSIELMFNKLLNQLVDVQSVVKTLHSNLKVLQKEVLKEKKENKKKESKIKKKSDKKKNPSGFAKPSPISPELATFLGISPDEQIARTDVTSKVIGYVKEFNLQNPENKKQIFPDEKLGLILQSGNDVVTFFNLQTYLKKHFINNTTVVPTVDETVDVPAV